MAVVAAYLMVMCGHPYRRAIQFLQARRFSIAIDDDIKNVLQSFEELIQAMSDVGQPMAIVSMAGEIPSIISRNKRALSAILDEDMDTMVIEDDEQRFCGRTNFTPYLDL